MDLKRLHILCQTYQTYSRKDPKCPFGKMELLRPMAAYGNFLIAPKPEDTFVGSHGSYGGFLKWWCLFVFFLSFCGTAEELWYRGVLKIQMWPGLPSRPMVDCQVVQRHTRS